jgi:hypothetical protein
MYLECLYPDETAHRRNMLESWKRTFKIQKDERRRVHEPRQVSDPAILDSLIAAMASINTYHYIG